MATSSLSNRVAIISGGLGDIGRAIGLELARRGADIALGDLLPQESAGEMLAQILAMGRRARYHRVDVADACAVRGWVADVEADLGIPDLIIPNAAVVSLTRILDVSPEEWRKQMAVNLDGAFYVAQAGARRLRAQGRPGRIVFIGSWVGHAPQPHIPAYCVTKAGLRMLCKCMALELAPHGILVNEVAPGNVDAGLSARLFEQDPALREQNRRRIPSGEMSLPGDIARQVAHLCDPETTHITGAVLLVDGGLSLISGEMARDD